MMLVALTLPGNCKGHNLMTTRVTTALAILLGAFYLGAQSSNVGSISVTILDPGGSAIPGANLELKDLGTNDIRRGQTSAAGTYIFPGLSFGHYQLTVAAQGFQSQIFESLQVQTARVTSVNATLQIGATTQSVTVSAGDVPVV